MNQTSSPNHIRSEVNAAVALTNLCTVPNCEKLSSPSVPTKEDTHNEQGKGEYDAKIFPQRLFEVLSDDLNAHAIRWLDHGRGFIITDRNKFATEVLPRCFKKTKYASFTRKMNRWNFKRVARGPEMGAYYHEYFQRGKPNLCIQMYCKNERAKFAATAGQCDTSTEPSRKDQPQLQAQQCAPSAPSMPLPSALAPSQHPDMHIPQQNNILLAAQQALKLQPTIRFPMHTTTAAVVDAALRALQRSNTMEASHTKLADLKANSKTIPSYPNTLAPVQQKLRLTKYRATAA